ncbi:UNVERIFIED_CONTAM: hypothetical protein HDU68_007679 [Siphonaria sp. JEL0065]|nr:hypothetical protein HDU68_007679 [Siphonaria sp. JEL0065]
MKITSLLLLLSSAAVVTAKSGSSQLSHQPPSQNLIQNPNFTAACDKNTWCIHNQNNGGPDTIKPWKVTPCSELSRPELVKECREGEYEGDVNVFPADKSLQTSLDLNPNGPGGIYQDITLPNHNPYTSLLIHFDIAFNTFCPPAKQGIARVRLTHKKKILFETQVTAVPTWNTVPILVHVGSQERLDAGTVRLHFLSESLGSCGPILTNVFVGLAGGTGGDDDDSKGEHYLRDLSWKKRRDFEEAAAQERDDVVEERDDGVVEERSVADEDYEYDVRDDSEHDSLSERDSEDSEYDVRDDADSHSEHESRDYLAKGSGMRDSEEERDDSENQERDDYENQDSHNERDDSETHEHERDDSETQEHERDGNDDQVYDYELRYRDNDQEEEHHGLDSSDFESKGWRLRDSQEDENSHNYQIRDYDLREPLAEVRDFDIYDQVNDASAREDSDVLNERKKRGLIHDYGVEFEEGGENVVRKDFDIYDQVVQRRDDLDAEARDEEGRQVSRRRRNHQEL